MATEIGICQIKRGQGKNMTKMKSPEVLWGDCLELEAYILSNKPMDIFDMYGITTETKISREIANRITF